MENRFWTGMSGGFPMHTLCFQTTFTVCCGDWHVFVWCLGGLPLMDGCVIHGLVETLLAAWR